ncbi:MAG TPA: hypothetical protein VMX97_02735 [Hyphomicrobiaceae bacterium]|nr:hypothetical protein [Hyphomicrobiaceae bacterium]
MTASLVIVGILAVLVLTECLVWGLVRWFRPKFQWLITRDDIAPTIDPQLLNKHVSGSFDPELGWSPRPHSTGVDETSEVSKTYTIDALARRLNPGFEDHQSTVSVFGDSYAFCRMVNDDETWPHFLSKELGVNVQNFGVGNYGIDQAYLRLKREIEHGNVNSRIVIVAFVPETISRIHSYWRHFYEYGNILAFKPRFILKDGELVLHPQIASNKAELAKYHEKIEEIRRVDPFYKSKFCKDLNEFPFFLQLITRWRRLPVILWHLFAGEVTGQRAQARRRAINIVLRENAREAMRLYADANATDLMKRIVEEIARTCQEADIVPLFVVMPQPVDIEIGLVSIPAYRDCVAALRRFGEVLDFGDILLAEDNWSDLFTDGLRGPHFHERGNRYVATLIKQAILYPENSGDSEPSGHENLSQVSSRLKSVSNN